MRRCTPTGEGPDMRLKMENNIKHNVVIDPLEFFNKHDIVVKKLAYLDVNFRNKNMEFLVKDIEYISTYIKWLETQILGG